MDNLFRTSPFASEKLAESDVSLQALIREELVTAYGEYYRDERITFPVAAWIVSAVSSS